MKMTMSHTQAKPSSLEQSTVTCDLEKDSEEFYTKKKSKEVSSGDEFFCPVKYAEKDIHKAKVYNDLIPVHLDDVMLKIEPDSGAEVNLMEEHQYKAFQHCTKTETRTPTVKGEAENPSRQA